MNVDENAFFRQATIRITSSLDIEKAMTRFTQFLRGIMPVSHVALTLYDRKFKVIRRIAAISLVEYVRMPETIPLSEEAIALLEDDDFGNIPNRIINSPEEDPIALACSEAIGIMHISHVVLRLIVEGNRVGVFAVSSIQKNSFDESHSTLLSTIREPMAIAMSNVLRFQEVLRLKEILSDENRELSLELRHISGDEIIGSESGLRGVMEMVRQVAPLDSPVLLLGETGVGKEVIANAVHYSSSRKDGPFIKVNCGAIPENLLDSELFGHEKGAFTGAVKRKRGKFERAAGGTIFLDEIGELPLRAQVRLLRVIQNREIERVGGTETINVNARIITATHRNLEDMIRSGGFREDLWYRLNIFPITVPPLRFRREDIPALVDYFIRRKSKELKLSVVPTVPEIFKQRLKQYHWPGNVRELENLVERALIRNRGERTSIVLDIMDGTEPSAAVVPHCQGDADEILKLDDAMTRHIEKALCMTNGRIYGEKGAAVLLGINPDTLRSRMRKLKIPMPSQKKYRG